ncbi:type-1 angiotensin II receptor-associated protein [Scyliorhinus canicula]|uniref:type-1 angiotensin II receptor-associated protein n=1 Tax=Scyliorhinus canicula TaxID=7830 RepID=UPI0018F45229|nr:type-1 angiotensin II receptor-associated protein [Scyliorhinus canicula]
MVCVITRKDLKLETESENTANTQQLQGRHGGIVVSSVPHRAWDPGSILASGDCVKFLISKSLLFIIVPTWIVGIVLCFKEAVTKFWSRTVVDGFLFDRGCLYFWLPQPYIWSNYAILAIGVWAIAQRDSVDALVMYLVGTVITILTDIIHIAISYDRLAGKQVDGASRDQFRFSVGMAILSLLLKPVSCLFVYQMYKERGGDCNLNFGFPDLTVGRDRTSYQTIDGQEPHHQPAVSAGTKTLSAAY